MAFIKCLMDLVRIILTVTRPVSDTFLNFVYRVLLGPKPVLPPIDNNIILMSATELAEKIRKKKLKAEEVMNVYIQRIKDVDPLINACVDERFKEALKEARDVDEFLSKTSKSVEDIQQDKPLLGVPFSCKEMIGVKGMAQTCGMYAAKNRRAEADGTSTSLYRKAGAIPVVVTNVPEMCTWWDTANVVFGRTKNPYDNIRTSGGSSGGEGAVLAYAGAVIGIGNDLAGSIRMPSAFNGVYGHKPSSGLISNAGSWPPDGEALDNYVSTGPMCRYAEDLPLLTRILSEGRINCDKRVDFHKIRIYYMEQFPGYLLTPVPEIRAAVRKASKYFEEMFDNKPIKIKIKELQYALEIWESKLLETGIPPIRDIILGPGKYANLFYELLKSAFRCCDHTLPAIYYSAIERRAKDADYDKFLTMFDSLKQQLDEILRGEAILLVPTHPELPPHYLMTIPKYPNQAYTCIFNVLGYPSTQIPAGLSNGLPMGIQAISSAKGDNLCIATAIELEKVFGGWHSPSVVTV